MLKRLLKSLAAFVVRQPWLTTALYLAAAAGSVPQILELNFKTDQNDLVAADLEYNQRYLDFLDEFGDLEFLYVVIETGADQQAALAAARDARERIERLDEHVDKAVHRIPPEAMRYGILHREPEELASLSKTLAENRDLLGQLGKTSRLEDLFGFFSSLLDPETIDRRFSGKAEESDGVDAAATALALLEDSLKATRDAIEGRKGTSLSSRLEERQPGTLQERGYLATANEKYLLIEILPKKDTSTLELIREPLIEIRKVLKEVGNDYPLVKMGLTGRPVLQADEMMTTDKDMKLATLAAFGGVLLLFVIFFRRLRRPLLCIVTLAVAILLTFALTSMTIGYLTLLSIVFAAMLVGLGIDFGIHFTARYQEELARGSSVPEAVRKTIETTGHAIVVGGITTSAAFYMTLFVDFQGLRELGFIAGSGVLICLFSMITLLPALILLFEGAPGKAPSVHAIRIPLLELPARRPIPVIAISAALTIGGLFCLEGLPYNPNLLELQNPKLVSVEYERLLIEDSDFSTWYAAFIARDLDDVLAKKQALDALPDKIVSKTESVLGYIPTGQKNKIEQLKTVREVLGEIEIPGASGDVDLPALRESLERLQENLFGLADTISQAAEEAAGKFAGRLLAAADGAGEIIELLSGAALPGAVKKLGSFQQAWIGDLNGLLKSLRSALLEEKPISPGNLPDILRKRFVSHDGDRFIVYAYANEDLWQEDSMKRFITAMRKIDPEVTGAPVQVHESAGRMREGFEKAALYSYGIVLLFLLLELRSLRLTLLAMVPLTIGLLWLLELLPLLGLDFNLANFFALPILIGCGVDGGVHIVHRFRETQSASTIGRTTAAAVTLSFLTTIIGFGAMATASHRGVASLGLMMIAGLGCVLAATVFLLPALLKLLERK